MAHLLCSGVAWIAGGVFGLVTCATELQDEEHPAPEVSLTMRVPALLCCCVIGIGLVTVPASASHVRRGPTSPHSHRIQGRSRTQVSSRPRGMDDARASEIQSALVKAGYLQAPSGHWDEASADAMRKMQADNGWQTRLIPDSRALIKLGLGPGAAGGSGSQQTSNVVAAPE